MGQREQNNPGRTGGARWVLVLLWVVAALLAPRGASAQGRAAASAVPAALAPWVPWVLDGKEEALCPVIQGGGATCVWPTRVELSLGDRGGAFSQRWRVDARQFVPLPGGERRWPLSVKVGGKAAVVLSREGLPVIELAPGEHEVTGQFLWDTLPESIPVPPESGLLSLSLRGARVPFPQRDAQGMVWLRKSGEAQEGDALEIVVHRRLEDEVPLRMVTRIQLAVAGKSREVLLGRALPEGFLPLSLESPIPTRVEADGRLRAQVRPGNFVIELVARSEGPVAAVTRPPPGGPWREGDEVWVFAARSELRVVEVAGVAPIDPQQTSLIEAWRSLPAYPMKVGDTLRLVESRRGDADPPPDRLSLGRELWIDFDGKGLTFQDRVSGSLNRTTRLSMLPPSALGRVAIRGKDQFITQLPGAGRTGVEIRQGELDLVAEGRFSGDLSSVPAVSWDHDFARASARLHLPPGFRIVHAAGVDDVPGTWVSRWKLPEIFLVLVLSLAIARLFRPAWGAVALLTLALTFPEGDAPRWAWAVALGCEALVRALPEGKARKLASLARGGALAALTLVSVAFLVDHVRQGLHPSLESHGGQRGGELVQVSSDAGSTAVYASTPAVPEARAVAVDLPKLVAEKAAEEDNSKADKKESDGKPTGKKAQDFAPGKGGPSPSEQGQRQDNDAQKLNQLRRLSPRVQAQLNADIYDPNAMVQTGPGLPSWRWSSVNLVWSGPVDRGQQVRLWLLGPAENLVLSLLRAALLVSLLSRLFPFFDAALSRGLRRGGAAAALLLAALWPADAAAQVPDRETLGELEKRLLAPPPCMPSCVASSRMALDARGDLLRIRVSIEAGARVAVPLPGSPSQWMAERVLVDGKPAAALLLREGKLHVALEPGSHDVELEGALPGREAVQIALPLRPHRVEAALSGWKLDGLHEDGLSDESLQLTREGQGATASAFEAGVLPSFVRVERTLRIGLAWQVETRVVRASPTGAAVVLEVPTLPGESVTTADVRATGGKVQVNLAPQVSEMQWSSVLDTRSPLVLTAPKGLPWVEVWRLDLSPIWHASLEGIPSVHPGARRGATMPEWRPWPGETLKIDLSRPDGVPGQTLTVDRSSLEVRPGLRSTDSTLSLSLRSSRGGQHAIELPEGAVLESLRVQGVAQPLRQEGRRVLIPLVPGAQALQLTFREPAGIGVRYTTSPVNLGVPSVDSTVKVSVSDARWVLWVSGPRLGPAVLFWSLSAALLLVAFGLSRWGTTPLGFGSWFLLLLGLSQASLGAAAVVVAWLLLVGLRERRKAAARWAFNGHQILLALVTLVALGVLLSAVHHGLLDFPSMEIEGNNSSSRELIWYLDRAAPSLPQAQVISAPLLVYRLTMLAWALWLAFAVLRWLRWGWAAFSSGGLWLASPPRPAPSAPSAAPAAPEPAAQPAGAPPAP